jgi:hypothetical protein
MAARVATDLEIYHRRHGLSLWNGESATRRLPAWVRAGVWHSRAGSAVGHKDALYPRVLALCSSTTRVPVQKAVCTQ